MQMLSKLLCEHTDTFSKKAAWMTSLIPFNEQYMLSYEEGKRAELFYFVKVEKFRYMDSYNI